MGLRDTITKAVGVAFNATDDIPRTAVITHFYGTPVRDPNTGVTTRPSYTYNDPQAIEAEFTANETRANIQGATLKIFGQRKYVPNIEAGDKLVWLGRDYEVIDVAGDPVQATYMAYCREIRR
jgi:hypothetical protein